MNLYKPNYRRFVLWSKTLPLFIVLFTSPALSRAKPAAKATPHAERKDYPSFTYHTLTMQCPYPDGANVSLMLASNSTPVRPRAINNLKNCLEPRISRWTAVI
jgi:hypothetical protein